MNYIHSKLRNRLSVERANKLQYIFINSRVLEKQIAPQPTVEELLAMEGLHELGMGIGWENQDIQGILLVKTVASTSQQEGGIDYGSSSAVSKPRILFTTGFGIKLPNTVFYSIINYVQKTTNKKHDPYLYKLYCILNAIFYLFPSLTLIRQYISF